MINRYTVIGQPIAHSLSPIIHQLFGELTQRKINYTRTEATSENFHQTVLDWQTSGAGGCNVTLPFKEQAVDVCDRLSPGARRAGSVNTIHMHRDGNRVGHNTDGMGLLADLKKNLAVSLAGSRVLLLGAGGAARGVIGPLLGAGPVQLHIANRTSEKAVALADRFADLGPVSGGGFDDLPSMEFDLVINASSASLQGETPQINSLECKRQALAYDMMYGNVDTPFMLWARQRDLRVSNGFGMLIEQAADAFLIWEGVRPKTRMAYPRLRELLKAG